MFFSSLKKWEIKNIWCSVNTTLTLSVSWTVQVRSLWGKVTLACEKIDPIRNLNHNTNLEIPTWANSIPPKNYRVSHPHLYERERACCWKRKSTIIFIHVWFFPLIWIRNKCMHFNGSRIDYKSSWLVIIVKLWAKLTKWINAYHISPLWSNIIKRPRTMHTSKVQSSPRLRLATI